MLRSIHDLQELAVQATDGHIGEVTDLYFDDEGWVIRYLVVKTGTWLSSRKVLVSPIAIGHPDWTAGALPVSITREQVKNSPDVDTDKPVSRQHEMQHLAYYGYPNYWGGAGLWGGGYYPGAMLPGMAINPTSAEYLESRADPLRLEAERAREQDHADPHLRSCNEVIDYHIHAADGDIGHVHGMLVEDATWAIRYIIVNTSNWWLGHEVLIAPEWIDDVYWAESKLNVGLKRETIKGAPAYDSKLPITREHEKILHAFYGHRGYWPAEVAQASKTTHDVPLLASDDRATIRSMT